MFVLFFCKQKTAYEMRISDWSSDVCSSDLEGLDTGRHAASLSAGHVGVLHGNRTYVMQDENGQVQETHSISAGLDYPGVGPEHAWLKDDGRAEYVCINDQEALAAFHDCCRSEGIMPALESAHALAYALKLSDRKGVGMGKRGSGGLVFG